MRKHKRKKGKSNNIYNIVTKTAKGKQGQPRPGLQGPRGGGQAGPEQGATPYPHKFSFYFFYFHFYSLLHKMQKSTRIYTKYRCKLLVFSRM